ncbi:MAG: hypothetical protein U1F43_33595 [Myxococcota bacterium]
MRAWLLALSNLSMLVACGSDDAARDAATDVTSADDSDIAPDVTSADDSDAAPDVDLPPPTLVETRPATALGLAAFSVNGRVQPRGRPASTWFEVGPTADYGHATAPAPLGPRLGAYYRETWDAAPAGLAGWTGGYGNALVYQPSGGHAGGFVRYAFPSNVDAAHADGIGANELIQYLFPGAWELAPVYAALGGGDPDFRRARVTAWVRGNAFVEKLSELVFWLQSTPDLAGTYDPATERWSNWAYSAAPITDGLFSGAWEPAAYQLEADTNLWTYAGHYVAAGRDTYLYVPLDQVLGHLNGDLFHMLTFFDYGAEPEGSIDIDDVTFEYANESLLVPSNGGSLMSAPAGDDPAPLWDGWRNGPGHTWSSAASGAPLELVWRLERPCTLEAVELHQDPEWPSKDVAVEVSDDGVDWHSLANGTLPESHPAGANFAFWLEPVAPPVTAQWLRVRVSSGYRAERWGLGEVELFGQGARMQTDDDWYAVTADIDLAGAVEPGRTYHYRLVAQDDSGVAVSDDATFTVPATPAPLVETGPASRARGGFAKVEGRVTPLGEATNFRFEFGPDTTYARATGWRYAGLELGPRTVTDQLDSLPPGQLTHYRLVAENASGTTYGADRTLVAE